ncbi:MAG TPA: anthranilate phosphoribosyltransferase [Acidobacteriaceae bacterium]|jgi:anthranilate phosphoribosyltransferase|nr:anthranilate phosphoribosyltransferase [Acidobacteriaceae bacterium]
MKDTPQTLVQTPQTYAVQMSPPDTLPLMALQTYVNRIIERRETLSRSDARALLEEVLAGDTSPDSPASPRFMLLAALLSSLALRGEDAAEIAGFVDAMRAAATPVPLDQAERDLLVDSCGTGADLSGTYNISTAAALVAAAAGATVAKHGNRAVTSKSGSADVLEALGIPIALTPADGAAALRRHRFAFLHAAALHPAMKAVMPVRRALGIRTIFHLVGPLSNPAGARAQVMGVYSVRLVPIVANAMRLLDVRHAFVVHGASGTESNSGIDELSISGPSHIAEVRGDSVTFFSLTPQQVGLASAPIDSLRGGDAVANAAILRSIFAGEPGPRRDIVLLNAAAVLIAAGVVPSPIPGSHEAFRAAIALAANAIDSGAVAALVTALAETEP